MSDSDELQLSSPSSSGTSKNKTKGKSKPKSKKSSSKSLSDDEEGSTEYTYATESDTGDTEASIKKASAASDRLLAEQEAKDKPSNDKSSPTYDEPGSYDSRSAFQPEPEDKRATNPYVNSWLSKKEKDKKLTKQEKKELKQKEKERKKQEKLAKKEAKSSKKNSKYLKANSSSQARSSSLAESRAAKKNEKSKTSQGKYTLGKNSGTLWSSSKDSSSKNKSATNEATTRSQSKEESSTPVSESDDKVVSKEGQTRTTKDQSKSAATASKTEKKDTTATGAKTPENIEEGSKSKEGSKDEEESDYTYVTESYTGSDEDSKQKSKSENEDAKSKSENEDAKSKSENEDAKSKSENEDAKSKSENEDAKSKSENEVAKSKSEDDEKKQSSKIENDSASKSADVDEQDSNKPSASVTASKTENAGGAKNGDEDDDTYTYTEISGDELVTATASKDKSTKDGKSEEVSKASKDNESKDQESQDVSKNSKNKEKSKSDAGSNEVSKSKGGSEDDGTYYYTYGSFKGSQDEDNSKETGSKTNERSGQESESKLAERSGQESKDDSNLKSNERTTKESRGEKNMENTPNRTDGKRARVTKRPGSKSSSERTSGKKSQSRSADTSKSGSKSAGRSASKDASKNKSKDQSGNEGKSGGGSKSDAKSGQKSKGDDDDDEEEYYYASETYSEQGSVSKTADSKSKDKKTSESKGSKAKDGSKNGSLSKSGRSADEERNDKSAGGKEKSVDKRVTNEKSKTATNSKALVKDSNDDESEYTYETEITHSGDETYKKPSKGTGSFTKSGNTASSASKNKVSNSNQYQKYSQLQSESYDDDLMRTMSGASGATSKDTASKSKDDRKRSKSDQKRSAQKSRTSRESNERGSREKGSLEKSKTSRKSKSSRESAKSGDSKSSRGSKTGRSGSNKKPGSERELKNQGGSRDSQDVEGKGTRTYNTETKSGFDDGGNPPPVTPPPPPDNLPDGDTYYETNGKNYKSGGTNDVPDFRSEFMGSDGNTDLDKHDTSKFKRSMQSNTAPGNNQDGNEGGSKKRGQGPNAGRIAEEEENANSKGPKDGKEKGQFSEGSIKAIGQIANKYEKKPLPEQQAETATSSVTKDKSSETKGRTKPPSSYQKSKSTPSWDKDKGGDWDEGRPKNEDQNAQQGPNEVNNKEQQNQEAQQVEKQDGEQKDPNQENMQPEDPTQANDKQQDLNQNGERGPNQENKQNEMGEEGVKRSVQGDPNQAGQQDPNQAGQQNPDRAGLPDPNQAEVPDPNQLGNDANKEGQQSKDQNAQPERLQQNTGEQQRLSATSSKDIVQSNNPTSQKQSKSQLRGSAAPSKSDSPAGPDPGKRTSTGIDEDKPTEDLEEGGESNSASMDNQTSIGRSVTGSSYDKGSKRTPSWDKDSDDDGQKKEQEPAKGATDPDLNDWKASESDKKEEDNPEEDATYQDNVNPEDISKSMEGERTDEEGERTDDEREMDGQEGDGNGSDLRGSGQRSLSKSTSLDEGDSTGGEEEEARQSRKKTAGSKSKKSANQLRPEDAQSKVRFSDSEESQGRDSKMSKKKSKTAGKTSQKTSKSGAKSITPGERSRSGTPKKSALAKKESKASKLKSKASKTGPMAAKKSKLTNKKSKLTAMKSEVTSQGKAKTPPPTPPPRCPFDDEERIEGHSVATSNAVPFLPVQMMYRVHEDDSQSRSNYTLESLGINETRAPTDQDRFHHVKHPVFGYPKKPLTPPPPYPVKQKGDDLCAKCGNEINDPKNNKLHPMNPRSPEKGKKKDGSPIRKPRSPAGRGRKGNKGAGRGRGKGKGAAGKTKMMRLKPEDASNGSPPKSPGGGKRCGKKCNAAMFVGLSTERVKCCDKAFDCCATPFNTMPSQTPRSGPVIINTSDTQPTQGYSGPSYSFNTSSQGVTHSNEVCLTRCGESHHMLSPKSGKSDPNIRVVKSQTTIYSKPEYLPAVSPRDEVQMMTDDMYELPAPEKPPSTVSDSSLYNNRYVTNYIVDHEAPPPSPASQSGQVTPMSMTQNSPMSNNQYSPAQNSGANQFSPGQTSGRTPMSYGQYSQTLNAGGTPMTKSGVSPIDNYDSFPQQKRRPHSPGIPRTSNYSVESNPTWEMGPMQPSNRLTDQEPHYGCASDQSDHIVRSVRSSVNDQNIPRYQWPTYVSNRRKEITLLGEDPPPEGCEHESHTPRESVQTPYKTPRTPDPAMFPDTPDNPEMMGQHQWDSILHKEAQTSPSLRHGRSRSTASLLRRRSPQLREKLSPSISVEDLRTGEKQILMPQRNHDHSPNHVSNLNARDGNLSADTGDDNFMTARKSWTTDGGKPPPGHPAGRVPTQGVNSAQKTKHLGKQPEAPPSVPRLDEIG